MLTKHFLLLLITIFLCVQIQAQENSWFETGTPRQLTHGPGNDMEAAVGNDGRIAYENDANGGLRICILDPQTGETETLIDSDGNEMAAYPNWGPDGSLVYAWSAPTGTAVQQIPVNGDIGTNLWMLKDGQKKRLTKGLWRDFTPSFSPDGQFVWMTTSRKRQNVGDGSHLARLELSTGNVVEFTHAGYGSNQAIISPMHSPLGKLLVWTQMDSAFSNWRIYLANANDPIQAVPLTPLNMSCYAPRWSPDAAYIAFTGYSVGDPGWGIWIMELRSGRMARVQTGPGNSKSPCWTADGQALVYENNATGTYKLYQVPVTITQKSQKLPDNKKTQQPARLTGQFILDPKTGAPQWGTWGATTPMQAASPGVAILQSPKGIDFGDKAFYVKTAFRLENNPGGAKVVCAAYYPFAGAAAWQIFVDEKLKVRFSSRAIDGSYLDVCFTKPIEIGKDYVVLGFHEPDGHMTLFIQSLGTCYTHVEPCPPLRGASRLVIGGASSGTNLFPGKIYSLECGTGIPEEIPQQPTLGSLLKLEME